LIAFEKPRALVSGPTFLNNSPAPAIGKPEKTTSDRRALVGIGKNIEGKQNETS
jgi:hypothetical protein